MNASQKSTRARQRRKKQASGASPAPGAGKNNGPQAPSSGARKLAYDEARSLLGQFDAAPPPTGAPWRHIAIGRELRLRDQILHLQAEAPVEVLCNRLRVAHKLSVARVGPMGWWFGSAVEAAWHSLHSVEEECARWVTDDQVRQLIADAKHHAQVAGLNDTAMVRELNEATKDSPVEAYVRPLAAAILRRAHEQSTASAQDARALRNRILLASLACGGLIAIVAAVIASLPPGTAIVSAAQSLGLSPGQLVGIVIVFGAVGGLFTAIPAFTAIPTDRSPYNLPLQQGILKIFLAPVTAAVGLLAIGAGLVDISEWSFYQLAAFATAFGAGQQAVTQAVDRWARIALDPKNAA